MAKSHTHPDTAETAAGQPITLDVLDNDDPGLTLDAIGKAPKHGMAEILDGSVLYTPDPGWHGKDHFTYLAEDAGGHTVKGKATVLVDDQPPTTGEPHTFTGTAGNDIWTATSGPDTFVEKHYSSDFDTDPTHQIVNLGHDTIKGFESGQDVIDYHLHFE